MHPFHYIVVIDHDQAGQTLFLRALAKGLAKQRNIRGLFVHADNERTDHLLQQGVMRVDARKRVTRETNRRLVDLFAEAGVGSVGLQWHQVGQVRGDGMAEFVNDPRTRIPHSTQLVIGNMSSDAGDVVPVDKLARVLAVTLGIPAFRVTSTQLDGVFVKHDNVADERDDVAGIGSIQRIGMDAWASLEDILLGK